MGVLIAGVLLWSLVHLFPALAPARRQRLRIAVGNGPWRGLFSLAIVAALLLIVVGWRSTPPAAVYLPPAWGQAAALPLMYVAVLLFGAAHAPTNLKRVLRHPMLTGVFTWSAAHLLANGDQRSLVLFGGLGAWALLEILLINRRDGAWQRPAPVPRRGDVVNAIVAAVVFGGLLLLHPYFAGVRALPQG